jgi:hypothetical protein
MLAAALRLAVALVPISLQEHACAQNAGGLPTLAVAEDRRRTGQLAIRGTVEDIADYIGYRSGL